jgi:phosphoribosyl-ATP pyrophosphohydrolase
VARDEKLLQSKLMEEARELAQARQHDHVVWEAADLLYFTLLTAAARGVQLSDVVAELDRRALATRRRDGSLVRAGEGAASPKGGEENE